jgi:hypothetical protein
MTWTRRPLGLATALVLVAAPAQSQSTRQEATAVDSTYGCTICHADKRRAFSQGVHAEREIRCERCHGGDPAAIEIAPAHRGRFLGTPTKLETVELCSECHADPDQMRQFGLSADQRAEFRTSRHGQLLLEQRNDDAPTCTDCHDAHLIRRTADARSEAHPTNIPSTCAACHEDEALMEKYAIPTDQQERFLAGAHGIAVFEKRNFAAPTCIGCHGSHAALPPRAREVTDVCGHCHQTLAHSFYEGPHGAAARRQALPGCLACHTNHGTERIAFDAIADLCASCHGEESPMTTVGRALQEEVLRAQEELHLAAEATCRGARPAGPVEHRRDPLDGGGPCGGALGTPAVADPHLVLGAVGRDLRGLQTSRVESGVAWQKSARANGGSGTLSASPCRQVCC